MSSEADDFYGLKIANIMLSVCSYIGYFFVFFVFWFFKELRSFSFELIVWLCISSAIYSIGWFLWPDMNLENDGFGATCMLQSLINTIFGCATMLISCLIGYTAYINSINEKHLEKNKIKYRRIFLLIIILVPLVPASM